MIGAFVAIAIAAVFFVIFTAPISGGTSYYPDGSCYLCRQDRGLGHGDTCAKCGTKQP